MTPIDLRSDTVTQPTPAMHEAMARAPLGDDVLEGDPSVRALEQKVADLLGKEAALFVPSGTMANLLALGCQTRPGDEVICDHECHIYYYEGGGYASICGLSLRFTQGPRGLFTADELERLTRPDDQHFARTSLVAIENTHNRGGGTPWSIEQLAEVYSEAQRLGLRLHMDGARLWNACAAEQVDPADFAEFADTISVCFSKGLGCPVGSALVGDAQAIARARRMRKVVGGAMRQAGQLAAAADFALDHHRGRLADDHARATRLAQRLIGTPGLTVDLSRVRTNMLYFGVDPALGTAESLCQRLDGKVRMLAESPQSVRAVTHLHITDADIDRAADAIIEAVVPLTPSSPSVRAANRSA